MQLSPSARGQATTRYLHTGKFLDGSSLRRFDAFLQGMDKARKSELRHSLKLCSLRDGLTTWVKYFKVKDLEIWVAESGRLWSNWTFRSLKVANMDNAVRITSLTFVYLTGPLRRL